MFALFLNSLAREINHNTKTSGSDVSCNVEVINGTDYLVTCESNQAIQIEDKIDCCEIIYTHSTVYNWGVCLAEQCSLNKFLHVLSTIEPTDTKCQMKLRPRNTINDGNFAFINL